MHKTREKLGLDQEPACITAAIGNASYNGSKADKLGLNAN